MLDILIGAIALGAIAKVGVDKVVDVGTSVRDNGFKETAVKEAKAAGEFAKDYVNQAMKEAEKNR